MRKLFWTTTNKRRLPSCCSATVVARQIQPEPEPVGIDALAQNQITGLRNAFGSFDLASWELPGLPL